MQHYESCCIVGRKIFLTMVHSLQMLVEIFMVFIGHTNMRDLVTDVLMQQDILIMLFITRFLHAMS
jgi:hypothetical protein